MILLINDRFILCRKVQEVAKLVEVGGRGAENAHLILKVVQASMKKVS